MTGRPHILLIDDDHDFVEATSMVLESAYDVDVAYDGETGLSQARRRQPDLIILDLIMPGADGFQVFEQIGADPGLAGLPVIMLTSLPNGGKTPGMPGDLMRTAAYLEKPVRPAELLRQVAKLLSEQPGGAP